MTNRTRAILTRHHSDQHQTVGTLSLFDGAVVRRTFRTLEPPWRDNLPNVSRIPDGLYRVTRRESTKYGAHLHLLEVPGRSFILIHAGNFADDTSGCILIGGGLRDIDADGRLDVTSSRVALTSLILNTPDEFDLVVVSPDLLFPGAQPTL